MNYALIFAGGTGQRMGTKSLPKQFLKVHGKEIIVYTIENFQRSPKIDSIFIVCIAEYIDLMKTLVKKYSLSKVISIIPGGNSGHKSIYNGLSEIVKYSKNEKDIVLIHDGVRPLINETTISDNIECVLKNGSAVTTTKAIETIFVENNGEKKIFDRNSCFLARAPQSFYVKDIWNCHLKCIEEKLPDFIDSASLVSYFGGKIFTVNGPVENIKITTQNDFFTFRAILDRKENDQLSE